MVGAECTTTAAREDSIHALFAGEKFTNFRNRGRFPGPRAGYAGDGPGLATMLLTDRLLVFVECQVGLHLLAESIFPFVPRELQSAPGGGDGLWETTSLRV